MHSGGKDSLLLPNLAIKGFRGIKSLRIPKLGRATLLTGKNGVGKTTVLEAARLWAARGSSQPIIDMLSNRGEITVNVDGQIEQRNAAFIFDMFWGRDPAENEEFSLGPYNEKNNRKLQFRLESKNIQIFSVTHNINRRTTFTNVVAVETEFAGRTATTVWTPNPTRSESKHQEEKIPEGLRCEYLGPAALERKTLVEFRDKVALTDDEDLVISVMNEALNLGINKIATIGEGNNLQLLAKIEGMGSRVPLGSLGEGATRVFSIILALASCKNGLLLIDDVGNGIHYSIQEKLWRTICQTAQDYNVQVIATTHSYDCIVGFAGAVQKNEIVEGIVVRIEDVEGGLGAVTMDKLDLSVLTRHGMEIR